MITLSWSDFKTFAAARSVPIQWVAVSSSYWLKAESRPFTVECLLPDDNTNPDTLDFVTNFKSKGNVPLTQLDSDGATFTRTKQAPTGWTFQLRAFELTTSTAGSLINLDQNNAALTDASIAFYDAAGNSLTAQADLTSSCTKTVMDWMPPYDYYLIGGLAKISPQPTQDVRLSVVGVPDYPAPNGTKVFIQNVNFRFVGPNDSVVADGRASKQLLYNSPVPNTNKIRFTIFHPAGGQLNLAFAVELFKV